MGAGLGVVNGGRRMPRRRALYFVGVVLLVSLLVVSTFGASANGAVKPRNNPNDARNKPGKAWPVGGYGEINGATAANDCWSHHRGEGMRDAFILFPIMPEQVAVGKEVEIPVQIINPWKQLVRKIELDVTLFGDQIVAVQGGSKGPQAVQDVHKQYRNELGRSQSAPGNPPGYTGYRRDIPIEIPFGAAALVASLELYPANPVPGGAGTPLNDTFDDTGYRQAGTTKPDVPHETKMIKYDQRYNTKASIIIPTPRAGMGNFTIIHKEGGAPSVPFYLNVTLIMSSGSAATGTSYSIDVPGGVEIDKGQPPVTIPVRMITLAEGVQKMEFHARAEVYYEHDDKTTPNEDFYNRYQNLSSDEDFVGAGSVTPMRALYVGKADVASQYSPAGADIPQDQWQFVLAESTGFAAAALLVPSLLLGGTYGKASRRLFNALLGGAKRRVMFHNLVSLGLSLVAVLHIILFTYEIRYTILMGVLWGGLGALSLLVLGLTGYYQVPLIQRHGYKWWWYVHLTFGLLVVVFVSYHALLDGADFVFAREGIPEWIQDINLAQK